MDQALDSPGRAVPTPWHAGVVLAMLLLIRTAPLQAQGLPYDNDMIRHAIAEALEPGLESVPEENTASLLLDDPLDLNGMTVKQLLQVPGVTPRLASRIVDHRNRVGSFASVDSLYAVPGLSANTVDELKPYLTVRNDPEARPIRLRISHRMRRRLDLGRGYDEADSTTGYAGGPWGSTTRIAAESPKGFAAYLTADHNQGEPVVFRPSEGRF